MEVDLERVTWWAKWVTTVAGALVVLWHVVAWGNRMAEAVEEVPALREDVQEMRTVQALTYCELRDILPADCELPD